MMHFENPNDGRRWNEPDPDNAVLLGFTLSLGICTLFASFVSPGAYGPALHFFLMLAGLASAVSAAFLGERPDASHLTRWDQAAGLLAAGLLVGLLSDAASGGAVANGMASTAGVSRHGT